MRVLQINVVYKIKSTGRTCYEVERALKNKGHSAITAYGVGEKSSDAFRIDSKMEYYFHNLLSRVTGLEGYFSYFATKRLCKFIKKYNPDVIHLRNLHGHYLNFPLLFKYLKKIDIPVVLNLHDCWPYTGKCCYYTSIGCYKWKNKCGNCPKKKDYPQSWFFDRSRKMRKDKEKWFSGISNLTIVGVSHWVSDEARRSFLSKYGEVKSIYNWINKEVFHPYEECDLSTREKFGIPKDKFMIIGVSDQWKRNTARFEDFEKLSKLINDDTVIVMVGRIEDRIINDKVIHIPYINDVKTLAKLYSCADVYIHCSVEDTFGKVIAEAMSCGLPAIVYAITGCAELVGDGCGCLVEPRNVNQIMEAVNKIRNGKKSEYRNNCVQYVDENFDYNKNTEKLISLYEHVCNKKS